MGASGGIIRVGTGGGVAIGSFTGANQSSPLAMSLDGKGMSNWTFQVKGTISAGGITVQGTLDGTNFFDLTPDANNTSTGQNVNPIISTDAQIRYKGILAGVRGVSNGSFAGSATLEGMASP